MAIFYFYSMFWAKTKRNCLDDWILLLGKS